jgi:hypothetical protein
MKWSEDYLLSIEKNIRTQQLRLFAEGKEFTTYATHNTWILITTKRYKTEKYTSILIMSGFAKDIRQPNTVEGVFEKVVELYISNWDVRNAISQIPILGLAIRKSILSMV